MFFLPSSIIIHSWTTHCCVYVDYYSHPTANTFPSMSVVLPYPVPCLFHLSVVCCLLSVCCLLCCLTLSLVYSILNSWISMELCIFPYQHRGGPRPTLPQKGLTVYSVGHSLPSKRGLSFHRSFHHHHRSGYNHLWVGLMWGSVWGLGRISVTSQPLLPTSAPGHTALLLITNMYSL